MQMPFSPFLDEPPHFLPRLKPSHVRRVRALPKDKHAVVKTVLVEPSGKSQVLQQLRILSRLVSGCSQLLREFYQQSLGFVVVFHEASFEK
jgi:hypothetical protein